MSEPRRRCAGRLSGACEGGRGLAGRRTRAALGRGALARAERSLARASRARALRGLTLRYSLRLARRSRAVDRRALAAARRRRARGRARAGLRAGPGAREALMSRPAGGDISPSGDFRPSERRGQPGRQHRDQHGKLPGRASAARRRPRNSILDNHADMSLSKGCSRVTYDARACVVNPTHHSYGADQEE